MKSVLHGYITVSYVLDNPDTIFVFGDNLLQKGKAGQAVIRDCPNAFGIPTKRYPNMHSGSFFSDKQSEGNAVNQALEELLVLAEGKTVSFPKAGLGTGLARMKETSPKVFAYMNKFIRQRFFGRD